MHCNLLFALPPIEVREPHSKQAGRWPCLTIASWEEAAAAVRQIQPGLLPCVSLPFRADVDVVVAAVDVAVC